MLCCAATVPPLQAMYRATLGRFLAGRITFKVTAKGLQRIADLPIR